MIHWGPFLLEPEQTWNKNPWLLQSSFSFSSQFCLFSEAAGTAGTVRSSSAADGNSVCWEARLQPVYGSLY